MLTNIPGYTCSISNNELNLVQSDTIPLRKLSQRLSDNSLKRQKCHKIKLMKEEYDARLQRHLHFDCWLIFFFFHIPSLFLPDWCRQTLLKPKRVGDKARGDANTETLYLPSNWILNHIQFYSLHTSRKVIKQGNENKKRRLSGLGERRGREGTW